MKSKSFYRQIIFILLALILLASCDIGTTPEVTLPEPTQEATVPVVIVENTPTQVMDIPAELVLWAPASADANLVARLTQQLGAYAAANNVRFERREQIIVQELGSEVKVVVALVSANEIAAIAPAVPSVEFLAIGVPDVAVGGNIHAIVENGTNVEERAFMAGYLLALITPDYRVGVLSQAGTDDGLRTMDSFYVGARFYCGLCNSRFGPILYYPKRAEITDPANPGDWRAAADLLLADSISSIFIQPEVSSAELVGYLETAGVKLVGTPGQAGLGSGGAWVGVLGSDLAAGAVRLVERLLAGEAVGMVTTGLELSQVNQELVSEGRLTFLEKTAQDLQDGLIRTSPVK